MKTTIIILALIVTIPTLSAITERAIINNDMHKKRLLLCAYNASKARAPKSVLNDNPCVVDHTSERNAWSYYGMTE